MARSIRSSFLTSTVLTMVGSLTAVLSILGPNKTASADPLLEIHNNSLTTYRPTATTSVQKVRPLVGQRGVNIDGVLREPPTYPMAIAGNPFGEAWDRSNVQAGIRLDTGTYEMTDVNLALPAPGFSLPIALSYNSVQKNNSNSHIDSDGYQGVNWFQMAQPALVFFDNDGNPSTKEADDMIYLVYGADRFIEFVRQATNSNQFKAKNGAAGAIDVAVNSSSPDLWTYYDQNGYRFVFFGINDSDIPDAKEGQLWKIIDPADNIAHVGDSTDDDSNATNALNDGYNSDGTVKYMIDSADRRYDFTYTSSRLTKVEVKTWNGSSWAATGDKVEYDYYGDYGTTSQPADQYGTVGDLRMITVTTPLTDSSTPLVKKTYFRYWSGTYNSSTNPGHPHQIKLILQPEGSRNFDWSETGSGEPALDDGFLTESNIANLKPYAAAYFEYDTAYWINKATFNGNCGCSGGSSGDHLFTYETNVSGVDTNGQYSNDTGYDSAEAEWYSRNIVQLPDSTYVTQYFDETNQPLHRVVSDGSPSGGGTKWSTRVIRNSSGQITEIDTPANISAYSHARGTSPAWGFTANSDGLVNYSLRLTSGDTAGLLSETRHKNGRTASSPTSDAGLDLKLAYNTYDLKVGDVNVTRPAINSNKVYANDTTSDTGSYETTTSYVRYDESSSPSNTSVLCLVLKQITTSFPVVSSSNNGSNSSTNAVRYLRKDGTTYLSKAEDGIFTYTQFTNGQLTTTVEDVNTTSTFTGDLDPNGNFGISEVDVGTNWTTTFTYDAQGRLDAQTLPGGQVLKHYYSRLADGRTVELKYADYTSGPHFYGPVDYVVTNLAGRAEVQAVVKLSTDPATTALTGHIDESQSDAIAAMTLGTVAQMRGNTFDKSGNRLAESRAYFHVPSGMPGTAGTDYDATQYDYDPSGRLRRVKDATGTIQRTTFDARGNPLEKWVGTNDHNSYPNDGGESSGTDDMTQLIQDATYDANNHLQHQQYNGVSTQYGAFNISESVDDAIAPTDVYDYRGRLIVKRNIHPPDAVYAYDNLNHVIAVGLYSNSSSLDATADPTDSTISTNRTNRLSLTTFYYDERGQQWKNSRFEVHQSDGTFYGSSPLESVDVLRWFDPTGRLIKEDGTALAKTKYDRLGRVTNVFTLASDDDSSYSNVYTSGITDVTGDFVLKEEQKGYDPDTGDVVLSAVISRFHDDSSTGTTGALDTNADNLPLKFTSTNVLGRIQITANWYDRFHRLTDSVAYGTYGGSTFDRSGLSVPSSSDSALKTSYAYNSDGTLLSVTDPSGHSTQYDYNAEGRQTIVTNSGGSDSVHTHYAYTNGKMTSLWVDMNGNGTYDSGTDELTSYTYGVNKSGTGASQIASNQLLRQTTYPDGGSVLFGYGKFGEMIWRQDQLGTIIESEYNFQRLSHRRVSHFETGSGLDQTVQRITYQYDGLGRTALVTEWNKDLAQSGVAALDEAKFEYSDWGPLSKITEDRDGAVNSNAYSVSFTTAKTTTGRNALVRDSMTLPDGTTVSYVCSNKGNRLDTVAGRVTDVSYNSVDIAEYDYLGVDQVVGTYLASGAYSKRYTLGGHTYSNLDLFNRVTGDRWTKDLSTDRDFYSVDLTYDLDSNITLMNENTYPGGKDIKFTLDGLNRLADAQWGTWNDASRPPAMTSETRERLWTLDTVGNWTYDKLDLNNDNSYGGTGEYNDHRTHNLVNELTGRDTDNNGTDNYTLTFNNRGDMTNDGQVYKNTFDAFGRLVQVKNQSNTLVSEYKYNGLGWRIGWHYDVDADGTVESNTDDPWYYFVYDDQWRIVGVHRAGDDANKMKEQFIYHNAGLADAGASSSYIDAVILRDKDNSSTGASDGVLEERTWYCQNWRADVVVLLTGGGARVQSMRYGEYGDIFSIPNGDIDGDGDVNDGFNTDDTDQISTWIGSSTYDVRGDLDLDGDVDSTDLSTASAKAGVVYGWGSTGLAPWSNNGGNRKFYAGYELDTPLSATVRFYHVRNRVYNATLGRWETRDPIGYVQGPDLYAYGRANPVHAVDPTGTSIIVAPPPPTMVFGGATGGEMAITIGRSATTLTLDWGGVAMECSLTMPSVGAAATVAAPGAEVVAEAATALRVPPLVAGTAEIGGLTVLSDAVPAVGAAVALGLSIDYAWISLDNIITAAENAQPCKDVNKLPDPRPRNAERRKKKRDDCYCMCLMWDQNRPYDQGHTHGPYPMGRMSRADCKSIPNKQPSKYSWCYCKGDP